MAIGSVSERIAAALAQMEHALSGAAPRDTERMSVMVAELRDLVGEQAAAGREMASLAGFLQTHSEREKSALARELHDALGGILTPAKMDLAWLVARLGKDPEYSDRMQRLNSLIDQGIDLKRRIIENLRPSLLDHLGLASALQWYVDEACRDASLECGLAISEKLERLPTDLEIALYRVVQDSVGNVVRHAHAKRLELTLERTSKGLNLVVADDGVGIADLPGARSVSHGLASMRHRVRSVNGTFDIVTQPDKGTRIEVFVPL